MASFNKVILMGNLTRDPELRYTPSGAPVCNFDLAVNRSYTTQGGERRDETCFITVVVWSKQAETCGEYLAKGRAVLVEGRLQQRSWETPEGQKRSSRSRAGRPSRKKSPSEQDLRPTAGGGVAAESRAVRATRGERC